MTLDDKSGSLDIAAHIRRAEGDTRPSGMDKYESLHQQYADPGAPPIHLYMPSDEAAYERHCEAEEPLLSRRWWIILGVCIGLGVGLIGGWLV